MVNRTVVAPPNTVTPETVAPGMPEATRSEACTDVGSIGSLKVTS